MSFCKICFLEQIFFLHFSDKRHPQIFEMTSAGGNLQKTSVGGQNLGRTSIGGEVGRGDKKITKSAEKFHTRLSIKN